MAMSKLQKILIDVLKLMGMKEEFILCIMCGLRTDEQIIPMIEYIIEHREATETQLLQKMVEILNNTKQNNPKTQPIIEDKD